ncbi:adaptin N terminal region-domain-containing protein [Halteromyces radiatus]|uniref:adaptin N terminal region-domain-containing protein n=1 Tax=Halteromyces radiatus TaxID=101107 RepID=UPI0022202672|nr:adaptin N terminal region-domain-containing protein [Halteromyces radiatus]KAI8096263.1 adaptin N terminal region-domain-containing protein [Halteromyces radiatus]
MYRHRFFTTNKRGENYELKAELNSDQHYVRSDAVKKVIANMTVGKDVSTLFPDVLKNMQTENIELKKLVYLYLMNYAKTQPELVILAVNTFVKDTKDPNPLIRALSIRTMGCIRVNKIMDYLMEPLRRCLQDESPYVRKTAALCVAKLYDSQSPELTMDLLPYLRDMISDINPMVVANAIIALLDINDINDLDGKSPVFQVTSGSLNKLLYALNECTEWGQVAILAALTDYHPTYPKEAQGICDRILPRLQHVNGAVVLSAIKVILVYMNYMGDQDVIASFRRKMTPSLATLLANPPEVQYIALRNIGLILQKHGDILDREMRVFFCKYNDPLYVKLEKLVILVQLCNDRNVDQLLIELKEYAKEVDVDFVRKSIQAIGQCAIKVEEASESCIDILLELINTEVSYVVQEAIVVIKNIFRKYPHQYEGILPTLCENLDTLDEPEAKAAMIWMLGEYADRIDNVIDLMTYFFDFFHDENSTPDETQVFVQKVLHASTQCVNNADIRDRGYIYWRLLSTDPQAAKVILLSEKPPISEKNQVVSAGLLDELIYHIGTLASVYHKPPESFIYGRKYSADHVNKIQARYEEETPHNIQDKDTIGDLLDLDWNESPTQVNNMDDVLSIDSMAMTSPSGNTQQKGGLFDEWLSSNSGIHAMGGEQQQQIPGDFLAKVGSSSDKIDQDTKDPFSGLL